MAAGTWRVGLSETEVAELGEEGALLAERLGRPIDAAVMFAGLCSSQATRGEIDNAVQQMM